jgi:hypothetical protein
LVYFLNMKKISKLLFILLFVVVLSATMVLANNLKQGEAQLVVDGDMERAGTADWTAIRATISKTTDDVKSGIQSMRITLTDANPSIRQTILTAGNTYRVTGWARGDGVIAPRVGDVINGNRWSGTTSTDWQYIDFVFEAGDTRLSLNAQNGLADDWIEFDDVQVTEYTSSMKGGEANILIDGDMERTGTANWSALRATLSKVTGMNPKEQAIRITNSEVDITSSAYQTTTEVGKTYRITGWARSVDGLGIPSMWNTVFFWTGTTSTDWQYFDIILLASNTSFRLYNKQGGIGYAVDFDNVQVTEYTPSMKRNEIQKLVDGDMERTGTANWVVLESVLSKVTGMNPTEQAIRITNSGASQGGAQQSILTTGQKYRITGWARSVDGVAQPGLWDVVFFWTGTTSTDWQYFDVVHIANSSNLHLYNKTNTISTAVEFDNVQVTEF